MGKGHWSKVAELRNLFFVQFFPKSWWVTTTGVRESLEAEGAAGVIARKKWSRSTEIEN
jgi:hypothetical protein